MVNYENGGKAVKKDKHRFGKNLLIWFLGFLFGFIFLFVAIAGVIALVKVKTVTEVAGVKTEDYFSEKVADKSLLGIIMELDKITVGDLPIVEKTLNDLVNGAGLDGLVEVNFDKVKELSLGNAFSKIGDTVTITATLKKIEDKINSGNPLLGSLEDLKIFTEWAVVDMASFNPADITDKNEADLYYYKTAEDKYLPAFNGAPVEGVVQYAEGVDGTTQLYLAKLSDITIDKFLNVFIPRLQKEKVINLLSTFDESVTDNALFVEILGETTVDSIGDISVDNVKVSSVLGDGVADDLKNLLVDAGGRAYDELTLNDLKNMSVDNVKISSVLGNGLEEDVKKLLADAGGKAYDELTLSDLKNMDVESIKVTSVLGNALDDEIKNLLADAGGKAYDQLTLSDLKNMNVDDVKVISVLGDDVDVEVKNLLSDAGGKTYDQLTFSDLQDMEIESIKVSNALNNPDDKIKNILADAGGKTYDELTLSDLQDMDVSLIKVSNALETSDIKIKNILSDAGGKTYDELTLSDLQDMDVGLIKVSNALETSDEKIKNLLMDAGGKTYDELTLNDLQDMDVGSIRISSVTTLNPNETLYKILADIYGEDVEVPGDTAEEKVSNVTIDKVAAIDINEVRIGSVINGDGEGIEKIYKVMRDAFGAADLEETRNVRVGEINEKFDMGKIKLSTVMRPPVQEDSESDVDFEARQERFNSFKKMIVDAMVGETWETITVDSLSELDINNIKLNSFFEGKTIENKVLKTLLSKGDVTMANMSDMIDDLKVDEIFQVEVFVKDNDGAYYLDDDGSYKYGEKAGCDRYRISTNAKVWLFLLYDYNGKEDDGSASTYTYKELAFKDLENEVSEISQDILNASIKQLLDAGFNFGALDSKLYTFSLSGALSKLSELSAYITT